jgi:hypothetical protein
MQFDPPSTDVHKIWQKLGKSDTLCDACQTLFTGRSEKVEPSGTRYYHHRSSESFFKSVGGHCHICYRLWSELRSDHEDATRVLTCSSFDVRFLFMDWLTDDQVVFELQLEFVVHPATAQTVDLDPAGSPDDLDTYDVLWYISFSLVPVEEDIGLCELMSCRGIGNRTDAPASLVRAHQWLADCLADHPRCKFKATEVQCFQPFRLIDVGAQHQESVRLVDTTSLPTPFDAGYTTLSHKWGSHVPIRLTKGTYDHLLKGIRIKDLPRTFRDAIELTRELRIRYIWIDSLCIFQDSVEDWLKQGLEMHRIYENGVLNIAATASSDSTFGLYRSRDPILVQTLFIVMPWGAYHTRCRSHHVGQVQPFRCVDMRLWEKNIARATLNSRAWVLQERFLSPRVLHCGERQLFWECKMKMACEEFPDGFHNPLEENGKTIIVPLLDSLSTGFPSGLNRSIEQPKLTTTLLPPNVRHEYCLKVYETWYRVIEFYSTCSITKEEEMLTAIAGLAKKIEMALPDRYLAGLFQGDLHLGLLWQRDDQKDKEMQHYKRLGAWHSRSTWRAPSWSWASVKGPVKWNHVRPKDIGHIVVQAPLVELLGASILSVGSDGTAQLSVESITVATTIINLRGRVTMDTCEHMWDTTMCEDSHRSVCCERILEYVHGDDIRVTRTRFDELVAITQLLEGEISRNVEIPALPTVITLYISSSPSTIRWVRVEGILLRKYTEGSQHSNAMERIGWFDFTFSSLESYSYFRDYLKDGTRLREILLF